MAGGVGGTFGTGEACLGAAGARPDDAICGVLVEGNVFYRSSGSGRMGFGGLQINGGKENVISNNIFAGNRTAISISAWGEKRWRDDAAKRLDTINAALYIARYPTLAQLAEDHDVNLIHSNLVYDCEEVFLRDASRNKTERNVVTKENPGFADAAAGDFRLTKIPTALKEAGFEPIPFERIGLYLDEYRQALPVEAVRQARAE